MLTGPPAAGSTVVTQPVPSPGSAAMPFSSSAGIPISVAAAMTPAIRAFRNSRRFRRKIYFGFTDSAP
jgi:hypothetical protein